LRANNETHATIFSKWYIDINMSAVTKFSRYENYILLLRIVPFL